MKKILPIIFIILSLLILRVPFFSHYLFDWDAVQLALGMDNFNIQGHEPHPPGYFLYVYLAKFFDIIFHNQNLSLIVVNVVLSTIALIIFYLISKKIFKNKILSTLSSFLFITNQFIWFHSEFANVYIIDLCFSIIYFYLSYLIIIEKKNFIYLYSALFALGIGFRQSLIIFFAPLYIYTLLYDFKFNKIYIKKILVNAFIFILFLFLWIIPNSIILGGFNNFFNITKNQFQTSTKSTSLFSLGGFTSLLKQLFNSIKILLYSGGFLSIFAIIAIFSKKAIISKKNSIIFTLWFFPSFLFYSFIHLGKVGYLMTISSVILILGIFGISKIIKHKYQILIIIFIIISQIFLFLYGIDYFTKNKLFLINVAPHDLSYKNLKNNDSRLEKIISEIKNYSPENTILITEADSLYIIQRSNFVKSMRHIGYYLPEYKLFNIFNDALNKKHYFIQNKKTELVHNSQITLPENIKNIILITDNYNYDVYDFTKNTGFEEIFFKDTSNVNSFEYLNYQFIKQSKN